MKFKRNWIGFLGKRSKPLPQDMNKEVYALDVSPTVTMVTWTTWKKRQKNLIPDDITKLLNQSAQSLSCL